MKTESPIVVKKFGGTSVGSIERIEAVAERVVEDQRRGQSPIVVASAMAGETNRLVRLATEIHPTYRGLAYDMLLASGEQVSIALLAIALEKRGVKAQPLLAYQLGIKTDALYSKARIQSINSAYLQSLAQQNIVPIVAGFQGISDDNQITTLGRGGSDTTAVALAAALELNACEIYTDVPAVCSADPRLVPKAREMGLLSFDEMMEMSSLGSKVLHFRCVELAAKFGVRIHLRSTFEKREGTWVVPEGEVMEQPVVSSVTHDANTAVFKLNPVPSGTHFLAKLFASLAERGVVVDIITQSHNGDGQRVAFSVPEEDVSVAEDVLRRHHPTGDMQIMRNMAKLSVVGVGMRNHHGVAAQFFHVLDELQIEVHLVTTSDIKISAVIDKEHLSVAAQKMHSAFSLDK